MVAIRVDFPQDNTPLTTGNGKFIITEWTGHDTVYVLDPLPHDRAYFSAHLDFINNYWQKASNGHIGFNTDDALLLPSGENTYTLSQTMRYYSDPDSLDYRLADLVYESVMAAVDAGDFPSDNDGVIIYHAGAGQDFNIDLDDSPFDIPSFFFDQAYLSEYLSASEYADLVSANCLQGVVLPESQNQLNVNIALNGTEILLTGMMLGLPTLYDTEFGRSGAGTYGLMDQGSNTGSGLCPIKPSAFERYLLGAVNPRTLNSSQSVTLLRDEVYKIPISSNEYFLLEFRKNTGIWADSLMWDRSDINTYHDVLRVLDSLDLIDYTLQGGVLTDISDLDVGLPTNGILIWHIVEPVAFGDNPNAQDDWFLNLVECDGGDDIGKWYGSLNPDVNNGWKWDTWFTNNPAYKQNNPSSYKLKFNDTTHPNSRSKEGLSTGIDIRDFKFYPDSAVIQLEMDSHLTYNLQGMVFDEMTTAAGSFDYMNNLIGYRDSSLYVFNNMGNFRLFTNDAAYERGKTALFTYGDDIIQVTTTETSSKIKHLQYNPVFMAENRSRDLDHPLDVKHLAIHGDSLLLPPMAGTDNNSLYMMDLSSWSVSLVDTASGSVIPYLQDAAIDYSFTDAAVYVNDGLIQSMEYGFEIVEGLAKSSALPSDYTMPFQSRYQIKDMIPIDLDETGDFEILALAELDSQPVLAAFNKSGHLLNNYPIFGNYTEVRVYDTGNEPRIVAYNPAGIIDIYDKNAEKLLSFPAPVDAASFFIGQINSAKAWIVADGSIYNVASDDVYWGYRGKDAAYSNAVTLEEPVVSIESDKLIKDGLIYNYPNPVEGDQTNFRFFATGASNVVINIYTLSGSFVKRLEQDVTDQQWNEITWYVVGAESGVYVAKIDISDGNNTETYFVKPAILK